MPGQEQSVHELVKPKMVVGREAGCDIHIDNLGISRNHCAFVNKGEAFLVQDLGSSNGTYVNGLKITERFLNDGDEIIIGKYTLKFKNEAQVADRAAKVGLPARHRLCRRTAWMASRHEASRGGEKKKTVARNAGAGAGHGSMGHDTSLAMGDRFALN